MSIHLRKEIEILKKKILALSAVVEKSVASSVEAIINRDIELADSVIKNDIDIDKTEVEIEEDCLKILALHQPVANDLRFIVAVLKINNDLERIGDLSVNVAKRAKYIASQNRIYDYFELPVMAEKAQTMLRRSLDSLVNMDTDLAHEVCISDDEVDTINKDINKSIRDNLISDPGNVDSYLKLFNATRNIERIADHATNIAEDVIYMIEGEIIRHKGGKS